MKLSIVIIFHNMRREAERTLYAFSAAHQCGVSECDYEVIAVDNGSGFALNEDDVLRHGSNFRYLRHLTDSPSPVKAVNIAAAGAKGDAVAVIVDGARMPTPGIVRRTLQALDLATVPVVYARSWHLGPDVQMKTMLEGYDQVSEDRLLQEADWRKDGYSLFDISTLAPSSAGGFMGPIPAEFSYFAVKRDMFCALGGFDERFLCPGGGLVNHHFRDRAVHWPNSTVVQILGEGVFHQFHGGVATNVPTTKMPLSLFRQEYSDIVGRNYTPERNYDEIYFGSLSEPARRFL